MTTPLERLVLLVPPPAIPARTDWTAVAERLGGALPRDYVELVDTYGGGDLDEYIQLLVPGSPRVGGDLVEFNHGHMSDYEALWEIRERRPTQLPDGDFRIITWATTDTADDLSWLAHFGMKPDDWPVVLLNDDASVCEIWPLSCTGFLADLLTGALESGVLPPESVPAPHTFRPFDI
jgi:hypothetical protein